MTPYDPAENIGAAMDTLMAACGSDPKRNFAYRYMVIFGYLKHLHGKGRAAYLTVKLPKIPKHVEVLLVTHKTDRRFFYVLPVGALRKTAYLQIPTDPKLWGEVYRDRFDLVVRLARAEDCSRQIQTMAAAAAALGRSSRGSGARAHTTGKPKRLSGKVVSVEELDRIIRPYELWEKRFHGMGGAMVHAPGHFESALKNVRGLIDRAQEQP